MSQYKWWKYRPGKLTRGQVILERKHLEVQIRLAREENARSTITINTGSAANIGHYTVDSTGIPMQSQEIIPSQVHIDNGYHTGQSVSQAIENLHDRVVAAEGPGYDYNISNGNCLDLTNALRDLSMEGYMDNELKEVLRVMLERYRSGQVHI